jgi:probable HAF family extracellular repeat protein
MLDRRLRFAAPAAALVAMLAAPARATMYDVVDLGSLGGARGSGAYDLSGHGVAVGYSFVAGTDLVHAMVNDHGTVLDLGTLGGTQSLARAVNAAGTVVGWAYPVGLSWQRAFVWQGGTMTPLGTFGGVASDAFDLNDDGMVVGSAFNGLGQERGFWWKDGVLHDVGTVGGGQSRVIAVNESGDYVGMSSTEGEDEFHAFLGKPGSPLYDLGTLGGPASHANDVNQLVHVCGWSMIQSNNPASRGFLWSDGVMKSLGTLGGIYSAAYGLNDLDQVVGASTRADEVQVAFLWANDQMVDLNTLLSPGAPGGAGSGWLLTGAYGIDVHGTIVGEGVRPDGAARAFLLVPVGTTDAPPPGAPGAVTRFAGAMPNPVRDGARFDFSLARPGRASLELLDLSGRRVRSVSRGTFDAGPGSVSWDGRGDDGARLAPGIYHAVFTSERGLIARRFVVVR